MFLFLVVNCKKRDNCVRGKIITLESIKEVDEKASSLTRRCSIGYFQHQETISQNEEKTAWVELFFVIADLHVKLDLPEYLLRSVNYISYQKDDWSARYTVRFEEMSLWSCLSVWWWKTEIGGMVPAFSWHGKTPRKTNNFFPVIGERLDNDEGKEDDNVKTLQDLHTFVKGPTIIISLHLNHWLKVSSSEDFSIH